ncbi:hypothetical protein QFZ83_003072 [Variovorax sp. W1I1]|nr:hypothetical protein [Variovorax sp. W1I1]
MLNWFELVLIALALWVAVELSLDGWKRFKRDHELGD